MNSFLTRVLPAIAALVLTRANGAWEPPVPDSPFPQEIARRINSTSDSGLNDVRLLDVSPNGEVRALANGRWYRLEGNRPAAIEELVCREPGEFVFAGPDGRPVRVALPWADVRQLVRSGSRILLVTETAVSGLTGSRTVSLGWPPGHRVRQVAMRGDELWVASSGGLFTRRGSGWEAVPIIDEKGRAWGTRDVRGAAFDATGRLWVATPAGVASGRPGEWRFFEGADGLPYADFTWVTVGSSGEIWFGTRIGAIRYENGNWAYRQGPRWLPGDDVRAIAVDAQGTAWFTTDGGLGTIERRLMTLAEKAAFYEDEIERYIKRTELGYTSEVGLNAPGDRSHINYSDSDNDGLWTAMYGAGECFAYAATGKPEFQHRARHAFEALRFLQKVTQGGPHSPPKGYVARTIRPVDWPDPNIGRLEADRRSREGDSLWKVYEPRWPLSADGKWYWKSDTSSDELDGHYFFYARYYDLVADDAEKERVREVVRDLTDHLIAHDFCLVDHDGKPTRWGVFGPRQLNNDPNWWVERGLNSLSILSYLAVAEHMLNDPKYGDVARQLVEQHGYGANVMNPKTQSGFGSGNQSDDEMAFMCFYNLLSYTREVTWREKWLYAFHSYAALELPEMNPFFNFAYAAHGRGKTYTNPWGEFPVDPWKDWLEDSLETLRGFSLDRVNWPHRNRHRLDLVHLPPQHSTDLYEPRGRGRGYRRVNGKVLPVAERHFNHWNTDPWRLDYGGDGRELASGTVFLLPYYMGLYHGFIAPPEGSAKKAAEETRK